MTNNKIEPILNTLCGIVKAHFNVDRKDFIVIRRYRVERGWPVAPQDAGRVQHFEDPVIIAQEKDNLYLFLRLVVLLVRFLLFRLGQLPVLLLFGELV
jgi:hypothetical protein